MFAKNFYVLLLATVLVLAMPALARADDSGLMVHYDCNPMQNRLIVKTFITEKHSWQLDKNDVSFTRAVHWGMPLECGFQTGDEILVKSYYGNGEVDTGAYQHVMIIVNGHTVEKLLDFNPDRTGTYRITAPSTYINKHHPQFTRDPLEDVASQLPPGYINFDGMSATDRHNLLADIRNRQP